MAVPKKVQLEKDESHNTEPVSSVSSEQHAALGSRKMSGPSHGGHTTEEPNNKLVVVPTSPQADSSLPDITNGNGTNTGTPNTITGDVLGPVPVPSDPDRANPNPLKEQGPQIEHKQPSYGSGGGIILMLGVPLIIANLLVGGHFKSLAVKIWSPPEGQSLDVKSNLSLITEVAGSVFFLIILVTIARINPNMTRPIVVFLIGLWAVWIIFTVPTLQKQGLGSTIIGQLLGVDQSSSTSTGTKQGHAPGHGPTGKKGGSYEEGYRGVTYGKSYSNIIGV